MPEPIRMALEDLMLGMIHDASQLSGEEGDTHVYERARHRTDIAMGNFMAELDRYVTGRVQSWLLGPR